MSVSRLLPLGGLNDFNLNLGGTYTSVTLNKEFASGSYSITSGNNDTTLDIYAYNIDGSLAGYTNTKSFTVTKGFSKLVILGGQTGDVLGFAYKTTYTTAEDSDEITSGPVVTSVSPSAAPKVNDTFVVTGRNFASNATVTFTSTNISYAPTLAKSVVWNSTTSLTVTRPDNLPIDFSPYTITVQNPGVINPTGSNSHILSNSLTAGVAPVWVTATSLPIFTRNVAYSTTVSATDADAGSAITYSLVSGSLATGLSLNSSTGVISGTPTSSTNTSFTIRATDAGGNYVDRAFTMSNAVPTWVTTSITNIGWNVAYSFQLQATDDSGSAPSYSLVSGSLPSGISLSSSGLISGTSTASNTYAVTFRATDANGNTADRAFSIVVNPRFIEVLLIAGGASGGNGASNGSNCSGGGGAGGVLYNSSVGVNGGTSYPIVIGAGGSSYTVSNSQEGYDGSASTAFGLTAVGGGRGGGANGTAGGNGGSGGGGGEGAAGGTGTSGQGNNGGSGNNFGGGGGAGGVGGTWNVNGNANGGNATSAYSTWASATGTGVAGTYAGGGGGAVGSGGQSFGNGGGGGSTSGTGIGGDSSSATANTGSASGAAGTGGAPNTTGAGGSGLCIIRYIGSQVGSGGSVSSSGGYTYHTFTGNGTWTA